MKNFQESLDGVEDLTELVPLNINQIKKSINLNIPNANIKAINSQRSAKFTRRSSSTYEYPQDDPNQKQIPFTQMQKISILSEAVGSSSAENEMQVNRIQNLRKKKERLRTLMRANSADYRHKFARTVEFGHDFIVTYNKQAGSEVKEVLYNKNIQSFISYNDKQIHVWRKENAETVSTMNLFDETGSHHISCVVYSQVHMLYLVISTDFKLHLFNEHLLHVGWLPLNIRLITRAYFYESKSTLFTAGIEGVFMFKLNVKNKYDPKQGIMLDPEGTFLNAELGPKMKLQKMPIWVKGLKINENQNIIFSWSAEELCLNNLDGKILFKYKKLTSESDYITDVFLSERYRYFVTSTFHGSIIVWKFQNKKDIIHNFSNHIKCVTALQEIPNQPTLFLSASNDCTIRIYSLDKFQELYCFLLPAGVHGISLLSSTIFACYYQDQINIGELHHLVQNFYNSPIEVVKIGKIFDNYEKKILNQPNKIMTLFSDNSIQIQKASKLDPQMVYTIFPPPGAKEVMFFGNCMNLDRIFVILVDGTICIYKFENSMAAILEKLIPKSEIKDEVSHGINSQNFTSAIFCQTIPPKFDSEIYIGNDGSAAAHTQLDIEYQRQVELYENNMTDRLLVLGLSKGTIIFLAIDRIERIYARLSFHSDAIQHIVEIPHYKKFISICSAYNICVWGFQDNRPNQLSYSQMFRKVDQISYMQAYPGLGQDEILNVIQDPKGKKEPDCMVLISFDFGDQQLFKYDETVRDLVFLKTELTWEHDNRVEGVDVLNNEKKLYVSGGQDSYVKIWNMQKDLIREIRFPERIYSVIFLNAHGDLLVGHLGKVSVINRENYAPDSHLTRSQPEQQALTNFFDRKSQLANTEVFFQIKKKVDELKKQAEAAGLLQGSKNIQQPKFIVNPLEQKQNSLETERKLDIIKKRKLQNKRQSKIQSLTQKALEQDGEIFDEEMSRILQIVEESLQEEEGRSADSLENDSDSESLENSPKGESKVTSPTKIAPSFNIHTGSTLTLAVTSPKEGVDNVSKQIYESLPTQPKKPQILIVEQNSILNPRKQPSRLQVAKLPNELVLSKRKTRPAFNENSIISHTIPVNVNNLSIMGSNQNLIKESPKTIHQVSRSQVAFEKQTNSVTKSTQLIALSTKDDASMQQFLHNQKFGHDLHPNMISKMTDNQFGDSVETHIISTQQSKIINQPQSLEDMYKSVHMVSAIPRKITEENYRQAVEMQIHRHVPYTRIGANLSTDQKRIPQGAGKQASSLTRRDYTFLRIQDNIEKFNDPRGIEMNEAKFGLHMIAGNGRNNQDMVLQTQQKPGMQPLLALMSSTRQGEQYFDSAYSSMQSNNKKKLSNEGKVTSSSLMSVLQKNPVPAVPGIIGVAGLTGTLSMRSVAKKGKKDLNQAGLDIIRNNPNKTQEPQNQSHISHYNDQQSASDFSPIQLKLGPSHLNKILSIQKVGHDQSQNQQAVVTGPERRKIELKQPINQSQADQGNANQVNKKQN